MLSSIQHLYRFVGYGWINGRRAEFAQRQNVMRSQDRKTQKLFKIFNVEIYNDVERLDSGVTPDFGLELVQPERLETTVEHVDQLFVSARAETGRAVRVQYPIDRFDDVAEENVERL